MKTSDFVDTFKSDAADQHLQVDTQVRIEDRGNFIVLSVRGVNCKTKKYIMSSIIIYHSIHLFIIPYYIRYVQQHNSLWLSRMYYYVEPMNVTSFTLPAGISEKTTKRIFCL